MAYPTYVVRALTTKRVPECGGWPFCEILHATRSVTSSHILSSWLDSVRIILPFVWLGVFGLHPEFHFLVENVREVCPSR